MTNRHQAIQSAGIAVLLTALLAGCVSTTANKPTPANTVLPPEAPLGTSDPCAMRLHDISGALLFYCQSKNRLPTELADLAGMPGIMNTQQLICPLSGKPYVYNPDGLPAAEENTRIIIHDPEPSHSGYRWAITLADRTTGGAIVTKVIALPESKFAAK